jgi:translation initiation factor IF-2
VQILSAQVIYEIQDELDKQVTLKRNRGMLQRDSGSAEVTQVFEVSLGRDKVRAAGVKVRQGKLVKKLQFDLVRAGALI